jgi:hypothetical protein
MLNKKYMIKHTDLLKVLEKYEEFESTFNRFVLKHKNYNLTTTIEQEKELWVCKIEVNESENNKVPEETIKASSVL